MWNQFSKRVIKESSEMLLGHPSWRRSLEAGSTMCTARHCCQKVNFSSEICSILVVTTLLCNKLWINVCLFVYILQHVGWYSFPLPPNNIPFSCKRLSKGMRSAFLLLAALLVAIAYADNIYLMVIVNRIEYPKLQFSSSSILSSPFPFLCDLCI